MSQPPSTTTLTPAPTTKTPSTTSATKIIIIILIIIITLQCRGRYYYTPYIISKYMNPIHIHTRPTQELE